MNSIDPPDRRAPQEGSNDAITLPFVPIRPGSSFVVALAVLVGLVAFDVVSDDVAIVGMYALAPFLTAVRGSVGPTTFLGCVAAAAALLSGLWNDNFGEFGYIVRLVLVPFAATVAHYSAVAIHRNQIATRQLRLLNDVTATSERGGLTQVLARIGDVAVPELADICLIDVIADERVRRVTAVASGPDRAAVERALAAREPSIPTFVQEPRTEGDVAPHLNEHVTDDDLRDLSHSEPDLEFLRSLGVRSYVTVPLVSRGRTIGAMTLVQAWSGRRLGERDAEFARMLGGRAALVLDNAGLFSDLQGVERRMDVVMDVVDEAVAVNAGDGRLLFANRAAVELAGCDSLDELLAMARSGEQRFPIYSESGRPLTQRDGPLPDGATSQVIRLARGPGEDVWLRIRSRAVVGDDGRPLFNVSVFGDVTELKMEELAQAVRASVSELLLDASGHAEILAGLASTVVPLLADACGVFVPADDGGYANVSFAAADPERGRNLREMIRDHPPQRGEAGAMTELIDAGEPFVISDLSEPSHAATIGGERREGLDRLGVRSLLVVPLRAGGEEVAVMVLANHHDRIALGTTEREIAAAIADRIALSVENAKVVAERSEIAETLQAGLVSPSLPEIPGWSLSARYRPAGSENRVGGDFYDFFRIESGWMAAIGDVTGHGARAATVTALARYTLRTAGSMTGDPAAALAELNRSLLARPGGALCTAVVLALRQGAEGRVEIAVAGHPPPLVLRADGAEPVLDRGPMLGAFDDADWQSVEVELGREDGILLYTDGLLEARSDDERFGLDRVIEIVATRAGPSGIVDRLDAEMRSFCDDDLNDDAALLALAREG